MILILINHIESKLVSFYFITGVNCNAFRDWCNCHWSSCNRFIHSTTLDEVTFLLLFYFFNMKSLADLLFNVAVCNHFIGLNSLTICMSDWHRHQNSSAGSFALQNHQPTGVITALVPGTIQLLHSISSVRIQHRIKQWSHLSEAVFKVSIIFEALPLQFTLPGTASIWLSCYLISLSWILHLQP